MKHPFFTIKFELNSEGISTSSLFNPSNIPNQDQVQLLHKLAGDIVISAVRLISEMKGHIGVRIDVAEGKSPEGFVQSIEELNWPDIIKENQDE